MIIKELKIDAFGKLENKHISLDDKINVIYGSNESGKSTAAAFIRYMLYGFSGARQTSLSENTKKRYTPWDKNSAGGEMTFTLSDGRSFKAVRKNAARAQNTILEGDLVYSSDNAGELFFGVSESAYKRTAFVGQEDISFKDEGELDRAIHNMVFSADESVDAAKAVSKLEALKKSLLGKTGKSGRIYDIDCELHELSSQKARWQEGHHELLAAENSLEETRRKINENAEKLVALQAENHNLKCKKAAEKLNELEKLKSKALNSKERFEKGCRELRCGDFFPDEKYLSELNAAVNNVKECAKRAEKASRAAFEAKEQYNGAFADKKQAVLSERLEKAGLTPSECIERINMLKKRAKNSFVTAVVFTLLVITLPLAVLFYIKGAKAKKELKSFAARLGFESVDELEQLLKANGAYSGAAKTVKTVFDRSLAELEKEKIALGEYREKLAKLLERAGYTANAQQPEKDAADFAAELSERLHVLSKLKKECGDDFLRYTTLAESENIEELKKSAGAFDSEMPIRSEEILKRETAFYTQANEGLSLRERELEKKAAVLSGTLPKPAEIESRIVSLKLQKKTLSEKYRQISLAAECLETASENMKKTAAPRISGRAGELFSQITDGKYRGLYTDGEMRLSFMENGEAKVHDAQYLSAGTLDLAYICLRTALCEYLFAERPTLIFDDAFAHMDGERLRRTLDFLCELSDKFQIIILTCHEREAEYLNRRAKVISF